MPTITKNLPVNGRVLCKLTSAEEPYSIVRVIRIDESLAGRSVELWLSLQKRSVTLKMGQTHEIDLHRIPITIQFVKFEWAKAQLTFSANDEIHFRELSRRDAKPE